MRLRKLLVRPRSAPAALSLVAQSAAGTLGVPNDNAGEVSASHGLFVKTSAGVSAGVVTLVGSMDGQTWFATTCTLTTNAASGVFYAPLTGSPFRFVAAKITTAITGGTVTAWVASC